MAFLTPADRRAVLEKVLGAIDTKFMGPDVDIQGLRDRHERLVLDAESNEAFETAFNSLLRDLGVSHTGFFHEATPRAAGRIAIAATFTKADTRDGHRWVFQDVHPGGVAAEAGIRPGDVLLTIGEKEFVPPEATPFALGERYVVTVRRPDGSTSRPTLAVPPSKDKQRPLVVPDQVVTATRLDGGVGLVRVSMFPGILGMDVARDMSRAVADLGCDRLIFDLRGNTGGGIGCLRLMTHDSHPARHGGPSPARLAYAGWAIAVVAIAGAFAVVAFAPDAPAEVAETRLEIVTPPAADPLSFAISPDGRSVVFQVGQNPPRLWLRPLASEARPLAGTDGAQYPFWSPDGGSVGFTAGGVLKRIDLASGQVRTLANRPAAGGAWSADGTILIGSFIGPLHSVPADGGAVKEVTRLLHGQASHRWPQFLPDGRRFLLFSLGVPDQRGVYSGSLDDTRVQRISDRESGYGVMPPGHLLFARQGALWARGLSRDHTSVAPELLPVATKVLVHPSTFGYSAFSSSSTGSIAYRASAGETQLVWLDRTGRAVGTLGQADDSQLFLFSLARDGRSVAVTRTIAGNTNVWLLDTERGVPRRLTFGVNDNSVIFSPDGNRIVHQAEGNREGTVMWERRSDGTGPETVLLPEAEEYEFHHPRDWSSDGRFILYEADGTTSTDLRVLPLFGEGKSFNVARTPFTESNGRFSPDGRWVAYQSDETGQPEIHVQPFPGPGPKFQVSVGGGTLPRWRRDGSELFYLAPDRRLMAVTVSQNRARLVTGPPRALFTLSTTSRYEPSPDGRRFLVTAVVSQASPITIILDWKAPTP